MPDAGASAPGPAFHWRTQPVINVSADGRSANLRTRLFHPDTGKQSVAVGGRDVFGPLVRHRAREAAARFGEVRSTRGRARAHGRPEQRRQR